MSRRRDAYTLVEMLIVVSIMIMLVAVALPVAKKVMDGSQGREASRQLHAYFHMAKARSLQTGRPCGLFFQFPSPPLGVTNPSYVNATNANFNRYWPVRHVTQVFMAEVPPYYAGGTTGAVGKIWDDPNDALAIRVFQILNPGGTGPEPSEMSLLASLINPGEVFHVRFNYKGEWYRCVRGIPINTAYPNSNFLYYVPPSLTVPPGFNDTAASNSGGKPFQILRSPRPVGNPLELPRGTCIDFTYSGVGNAARMFPLPTNITTIASNLAVMLSPNGGIDSMYINGFPTEPPAASMYFLVGKVEKAGDPYALTNTTLAPAIYDQTIYADIEQSNLADPNSVWVVVSRGTGQVTTAENMPGPPGVGAMANQIGPYLLTARQAAIHGEQMTGQ